MTPEEKLKLWRCLRLFGKLLVIIAWQLLYRVSTDNSDSPVLTKQRERLWEADRFIELEL